MTCFGREGEEKLFRLIPFRICYTPQSDNDFYELLSNMFSKKRNFKDKNTKGLEIIITTQLDSKRTPFYSIESGMIRLEFLHKCLSDFLVHLCFIALDPKN